MERVERHLGGGFANGLRGKCADHLARVGLGRKERGLDLTHDPLEGLLGKPVLGHDLLGGKGGPHQRAHKERGILLGVERELVVALDDNELGDKLTDVLNDGERVEVGGGVLAQIEVELLLGVDDESLDVDRQNNRGVALGLHHPEHLAVLAERQELFAELVRDLRVRGHRLGNVVGDVLLHRGLVEIELVTLHKIDIALFQGREVLELEQLAAHAVLAVQQLDHLAVAIAHRAVVPKANPFHRLDKPTLDVASLGGFDGRVDQTLATTHSMEVELSRGEAVQIRVEDEAAGLRAIVVLVEVRERTELEPKLDALALDVLLPNAGDDLRNIERAALGAG